MHPATYTQTQRGVIDGLLGTVDEQRALVPNIMTAADGTVLAWCLWEYNILHYVWVAQPLRKSGFASRILREHGADRNTVVSHWSDAAQRCFDGSQEIRQLFSATNSHHPRYSPTLATNPNAFVAM